MKSTPLNVEPSPLPSSVPLDIATGAPVPQTSAANSPDNLPPQLASSARLALAIAQGEHDTKRQAATEEPGFREAAAWLRGKSSQRILIEIVMRLSKLEKDNEHN